MPKIPSYKQPDKDPKCPKCGFVMCEQFDERPVTAIASLAIPNSSYICYHCKITKKIDEL